MTFWNADTIRTSVQGRWLSRVPLDASLDGVVIDSREAGPRSVFFAIKGEKTDGHLFLTQAAEAGSPLIIVHDEAAVGPEIRAKCGVLLVTETGAALLKLASAYRGHIEGTRIIAVGGSNGKTTTVRLIEAVLATQLKGSASKKSFNNAIGVPLTVLAAKKGDQYLICEVGTNAPGEISPLVAAIRPDIGVLTSIGREHLEGLGSLDGVIHEELTLFSALKPGGLAVLPADVPELRAAVRRSKPIPAGAATVWFGTMDEADLRVSGACSTSTGTTFTLNEREKLAVPLAGVHNATNAAAAIAVARRLGIPEGLIASGLAAAKGPPMRMEQSRVGGVTFLDDSYNANPDSMLRSIDAFFGLLKTMSPARAVMVLGDMLELGGQAADLHREVLRAAAAGAAEASVPVRFVLVGGFMAGASTELGGNDVTCVPDAGGAYAPAVAASLQAGDFVLLKGSRSTAVDRVLEAFRTTLTQHPSPATA